MILQLEEIGDAFLEPIGPEMRAGLAIDKLRVDAHPVLVALHRAFEDIAHAQFLADLLGVDVLALEGEGGVARDHEAVADAREVGREVLRDAVGEIILAWIAREVREGQHHDGKMRGVGPRCWCIRGDGRRSVRAEEIPSAARNRDECDDPRAQQREHWHAAFVRRAWSASPAPPCRLRVNRRGPARRCS